jgi:hypothetical protein
MPSVIGVDAFHRFGNFTGRFECDQTVTAAAKEVRKTGVLDDNRTTGGEITAAPVAEPTGVESNVLVLRHCEFAFGTANVVAVKAMIRAQIVGRPEPPALLQELFAGRFVLDVRRELERFARAFGGGNEVEKLARFAP